MSKPPPTRYRNTNWSSYNASLRTRGSLLIWVDKDTWLGALRMTVGQLMKVDQHDRPRPEHPSAPILP